MTRTELLALCPSMTAADADRLLTERPDFGKPPRCRRLLPPAVARREGNTHRIEDVPGAILGAPVDPRPGILAQLDEAARLAAARGAPATATAALEIARQYYGLGSDALDGGNAMAAAGLFFAVGLTLGQFRAELHRGATLHGLALGQGNRDRNHSRLSTAERDGIGKYAYDRLRELLMIPANRTEPDRAKGEAYRLAYDWGTAQYGKLPAKGRDYPARYYREYLAANGLTDPAP